MRTLLATILLLACALAVPAQTKRHFYSDKKWWIGEAVIGASWLASGIAINHTRAGATNLFGNNTTSGKIALFETGIFSFYSGLHIVEWKLGHDDPKKGWRIFSYTAIPAVSASFGAATAVDALNSTPTHSYGAVPQFRCPKNLVC